MTENRIFIESALYSGMQVELNQTQAHYLVRVLRLGLQSRVLVFNGRDGEWRAEIVSTRKHGCSLKMLEQTRLQPSPQRLQYAFAPLKHARLDYLVQKAVELGASRLQPVMTAHTAVSRVNLERMHANVIEAAEQCGILNIPAIAPPITLDAFLRAFDAEGALVFCDERAGKDASPVTMLSQAGQKEITVMIGPEGGFSLEERNLILSKPFVVAVSLGPRIMRADTAAVAILSLVNAVCGDWL